MCLFCGVGARSPSQGVGVVFFGLRKDGTFIYEGPSCLASAVRRFGVGGSLKDALTDYKAMELCV